MVSCIMMQPTIEKEWIESMVNIIYSVELFFLMLQPAVNQLRQITEDILFFLKKVNVASAAIHLMAVEL
jgi:hypothetical protein